MLIMFSRAWLYLMRNVTLAGYMYVPCPQRNEIDITKIATGLC